MLRAYIPHDDCHNRAVRLPSPLGGYRRIPPSRMATMRQAATRPWRTMYDDIAALFEAKMHNGGSGGGRGGGSESLSHQDSDGKNVHDHAYARARLVAPLSESYGQSTFVSVAYKCVHVFSQREIQPSGFFTSADSNDISPAFEALRQEILSFEEKVGDEFKVGGSGRMGSFVVFTSNRNWVPEMPPDD
jgi:hypothetical protein